MTEDSLFLPFCDKFQLFEEKICENYSWFQSLGDRRFSGMNVLYGV